MDASGNIYIANFSDSTVTVYLAGNNGNVAPSSTIGGSNTGLDRPVGVALDASGKIYVTNQVQGPLTPGTVTVYPAGSEGNIAPKATIAGSNTGLEPGSITVDASGNIYVANT